MAGATFILRITVRALAMLLISGLVGASLVRFAPGFGADPRQLDPRLSNLSIQELRERHRDEEDALRYYARYLGALLHGDAGRSAISGRPVSELIAERAPTTVRSVLLGSIAGWCGALLAAAAAALNSGPLIAPAAAGFSASLISVPSAVLAALCLLLQLPPFVAIGAVVFPRVFPHAYRQIEMSLGAPHVAMARARGVPPVRRFFVHVMRPVLLPLLALAGVSVTLSFGASIPIEAFADSPGLGQLAWRAALGRDMAVLVSITLLLTFVTVFANTIAEILSMRLERGAR